MNSKSTQTQSLLRPARAFAPVFPRPPRYLAKSEQHLAESTRRETTSARSRTNSSRGIYAKPASAAEEKGTWNFEVLLEPRGRDAGNPGPKLSDAQLRRDRRKFAGRSADFCLGGCQTRSRSAMETELFSACVYGRLQRRHTLDPVAAFRANHCAGLEAQPCRRSLAGGLRPVGADGVLAPEGTNRVVCQTV